MVRRHGIHSVDMAAGHCVSPPEFGINRVTDHRETLYSPEITDAVKTTLRSLLQAGRRSLLAQLHGMVMPVDPASGWQGSDDEFAGDAVASEMAMIPVLCINRELQQIEDALQRIGRDGFGNCVYCRGPIEQTRLEGRPTVRSCLRCEDRLRLPALSSGGL